MKKIKLTQGQSTLVDDEDFEELNQYKWKASYTKSVDGFYTTRNPHTNGRGTTVSMSRIIMNCPKGKQVDHINHDTLDNRKENLRICSRSENQRNRPKHINNKSGYKGVCWHKRKGKFISQIKYGKETIYLGYFDDPVDAARAYDEKAKELHGEFVNLNFPNE